MKKLLMCTLICLTLTGCQIGKPVQSSPLTIGFIGPLSGDASTYGIPIRNAVQLAVNEINSQGGIAGRELEVIYEDGQCTGKDATLAAQKLINIDQVSFIIGGVCSGETIAIAPLAETHGVILFSPASGSPEITDAGDYIFRNFSSDAFSGKRIAEYAQQQGYQRVAVLAENTPFATALQGVFNEEFVNKTHQVIFNEHFSSEESDFRSQLTKIRSADPDAIYVIPQTVASAVNIYEQMDALQIEKPLLSTELMNSATILEEQAHVIEGLVFAAPQFDEEAPATQRFLASYLERYKTWGDLPPIYIAIAYDVPYIYKETVERVGTNTDDIKNALYQIGGRPGAGNTLTIDENGDAVLDYDLKQIRNKQAVPL